MLKRISSILVFLLFITIVSSCPNSLSPANAQSAYVPGFSCYRDLSTIYERIHQLQNKYPDLLTVTDIGDSWEKQNLGMNHGHDLLILKLEANPSPKPTLILISGLKANSFGPVEINLRFTEFLLSAYPKQSDVRYLIDHFAVHFFCLSPIQTDVPKLKTRLMELATHGQSPGLKTPIPAAVLQMMVASRLNIILLTNGTICQPTLAQLIILVHRLFQNQKHKPSATISRNSFKQIQIITYSSIWKVTEILFSILIFIQRQILFPPSITTIKFWPINWLIGRKQCPWNTITPPFLKIRHANRLCRRNTGYKGHSISFRKPNGWWQCITMCLF